MKSLQILFLAVMLACTTPSFASNLNPIPTPNPKANNEISYFISQQLSTTNLSEIIEENEAVQIEFQITRKDEIIVMKTNTKDKGLDSYIKSRLNYESLNIAGLKHYTTYFITVEFVKK